MNITFLQNEHHSLLYHLQINGYTQRYIQQIKSVVLWILKNVKSSSWHSYQDAYRERVSKAKSESNKANLRTAFAVIERFDLYGELPNRRRSKNSFIKRAAFHQLTLEFKELIDFYNASSHLKDRSTYVNASSTACFLIAMQQRGKARLEDIHEEDVLSFFLDSEGNLSKSQGYRQQIATVFKLAMAWKEKECRAILAYLPPTRTRRKNIQFLTFDEVEAIRKVLHDDAAPLSLRDRAIGNLLFYTGMRACDIVAMTLNSIHWKSDEIHLSQQKTSRPLILPLTAIVGNAIFDYLVKERPVSNCSHLFLAANSPHDPFTASVIWHLTEKIFRIADIRQGKDQRRGPHLFRHNIATFFLGSGIPKPVISQILGHGCPFSLDPYLHADIVHLKACALSIEIFPVCEEVFK